MKHIFAVSFLLLTACSIPGQTNDTVLSEVSVLTIHVSDTNTHGVVFHFLTDVLKLPVDYGPVMLGQRRYGAVYAGNLFMEPCGPYSNMQYPVKEFKALFFGLNCRSDKSPSAIAAHLDRLKLAYQKAEPTLFRIQDPSIAEGIYLAIDSRAQDKAAGDREASLASAMAVNNREGLGLEYVKEIWLGYTEPANVQAWKEFLGASGRANDTLWRLNKNQSIRFVKSEVRGVRGIVCRVQSLEKAERYLKETKAYGSLIDGRIPVDPVKACGLLIYLTAE